MTSGDDALVGLAAEVGGTEDGPVVAVGAGTAEAVPPGVRAVRAPAGIVEHQPDEMTVRVRAGTPVRELLDALAQSGQEVALPCRGPAATVGGAVAQGWSDLRRLGIGPVRDAVLECRAVLADGRLVKAGGPTVKNVTGYDLCRVLVGSRGTLAVLGEVVLRTRPLPPVSRWFVAPAPGIWRRLHRPAAALWDGSTTWLLLEGHPADIEAAAGTHGLVACAAGEGPPTPASLGLVHRWSVPPARLGDLPADGHGPFLAELGVGVVHRAAARPAMPVSAARRALEARLKTAFDPTGRLAPGRTSLAGAIPEEAGHG